MPAPSASKPRLAYIDWMRGLACVLMFQTHCFDSWLGGQARQSRFFMDSQLGGTFPAPLFLFLAGISFALVTEKLRQKGLPAGEITRSTIRRGAEIFGFGLLFRLQEYVIAWGWAPKSDLLRVDILNAIGLSMMLMGVLCWVVLRIAGTANVGTTALGGSAERSSAATLAIRQLRLRSRPTRVFLVLAALGSALAISFMTPLLWTTWRPDWLPWPIESYINGVHNLGAPQAWLFPIFPWAAFAFAGLGVGFILQSEWMRAREAKFFFGAGIAGLLLIELSRWLDALPWHVYAVYDYWHTSPDFFLIRVGMLLVILCGCYVWCRWGAAQWGFSPLIQLGQASLLVYWVHIEFVYGRVSILTKHAESISGASLGLAIICVAMVALAYIRTHTKGWMKGRGAEVLGWLRPARAS
ncbi:MAG: heparan-alpha-glucosaminide N-acetyltransferase domain-containing protein [Candidatus Sulfotelmatobacter sp.]